MQLSLFVAQVPSSSIITSVVLCAVAVGVAVIAPKLSHWMIRAHTRARCLFLASAYLQALCFLALASVTVVQWLLTICIADEATGLRLMGLVPILIGRVAITTHCLAILGVGTSLVIDALGKRGEGT